VLCNRSANDVKSFPPIVAVRGSMSVFQEEGKTMSEAIW
jgi:hypothetical protein